MTDQDRIDTKTANAWANLYREDGKVDWEGASEVIHNATGYPILVPMILQSLQQPEMRDELAGAVLEALMGFVRDEFAGKVQAEIEGEDERENGPAMEAWEDQESEKMEDYRERMNGNA